MHAFFESIVPVFAQGEGQNDPGWFGSFGMLFPFIAIAVLFYFMLIRPQRREQAKMKDMLEQLKKNDRVETAGGIYGTVVNVQKDSRYVTIKVDEATNAKLRIVRSSVVRVLTDEDVDDKKDAG